MIKRPFDQPGLKKLHSFNLLFYDNCLSSFVSLDLVFFIVPTRMKIHYIVPFWNAKGNVYMKSFRKFENKFRTCIDVVVGVKLPGIIDWAK